MHMLSHFKVESKLRPNGNVITIAWIYSDSLRMTSHRKHTEAA